METRTVETAQVARGDEFAALAAAEKSKRKVDQTAARDAGADAVRVDISASFVRQAVAKAKEGEDKPKRTSADASDELKARELGLEEVRERYESSINSTEVRFDVSIRNSGKSSLFFQVVEKESGKVIRQFPPEELIELAEQQAEKAENVGRLIRASA